jgi:hypothetical protein
VEHLVKFTSAEGRDGFHTAESLDGALKFVERLRNNEEVGNVRLFRLQEVPIEFKAYYKVEIRGAEAPASGNQPDETAADAEGDAVQVELPDGTRTPGAIADVGDVATSSGGDEPQVARGSRLGSQ